LNEEDEVAQNGKQPSVPVDRSYIERNVASRDHLSEVLARLSDEDCCRPLGDGWTVTAALAHLAFWDRAMMTLLDKWEQQGLPTDNPQIDINAFNDARLPGWLATPSPKAKQEALAAAEEMDARVAGLPDEMVAALLASGRPWVLERTLHRRAHLAEIEQALAS
jgi:hypothetical protein